MAGEKILGQSVGANNNIIAPNTPQQNAQIQLANESKKNYLKPIAAFAVPMIVGGLIAKSMGKNVVIGGVIGLAVTGAYFLTMMGKAMS